MAMQSRTATEYVGSFRFLIKRDRDGRHRWSLYNAWGTLVDRHAAGFPSELEAYQDVERLREELTNAPVIGEQATAITALPGRAESIERAYGEHEKGGRT
jgi:hypothetical protein